MVSTDRSTPENWQSIEKVGWVGKEHFESFQALHDRLFSKHLAGSTFNHCIQGGGPHIFTTEATNYGGRRITGFRQFTPLAKLTVAPRQDVGLGPYPRSTQEYPSLSTICRQYAIEAYSLIAAMQQEAGNFEQDELMKPRDVFLQAIAGTLATRLALD